MTPCHLAATRYLPLTLAAMIQLAWPASVWAQAVAVPPTVAASAPAAEPRQAPAAAPRQTPAAAPRAAPAPAVTPAATPTAGQPAAAPTTVAPVSATPQQVQITGTTAAESNAERRSATASRITFGREELDRMGDATLGEVLKRLPGVSTGGPPGRGGQVRMRGMGGGYTQILIDGQRMAPGFSLDSIAPEQIEKIEIMRAPVAEFGTRAIAGTINVVMRSDFKRKSNEFRVGGGADGERGQVGASWMANGNTDLLGYNLSTTLFKGGQQNESDTRTLGLDPTGATLLDQQAHSESISRRQGLFANARLQFRLAPGESLDVQPFFNAVRTRSDGQATLLQPVGALVPYTAASSHTETDWQMARLNGTWLTPAGTGGRLQLRFGGRLSSVDSVSQRQETGGSAAASRLRSDDSGQREMAIDLSGKFSQLLAERHSASAGWELQHSQRDDRRKTLVNGLPTLTEFGENIEAKVQRIAVFAQDEWEWSKQFSFYAGARWEAIETRSDSALERVSNRSAVFTPLAHMVWKLPDRPRDQVRLSLTRSYRSPDTNQLIARPTVSTLYPDLTLGNQPTSPDRGGNARLKPELAWGLELGIEHYLDGGGLLSANVYARRIDELIRTVRGLETVSYAMVPRWVARPQNVGAADAAGLEFEAKGRLVDLWAGAPVLLQPLSLRSNLSLMWSRVDQVAGPNNRIEGQPPWTANLGADWQLKGTPLTVGASLNFTPGFTLAQIDNQTYRQGIKRVIDGNLLWRFSADASARLTLSNAGARPYDTGLTTLLADGSSQASDTSTRSFTTVNLRGEFRF